MNREFNVAAIRELFPALHQKVNSKPLVYFDNAATTQKPKAVIERIQHYYDFENSNIHRGVHYLSQQATEAYENARNYIAELIHAKHAYEVIFTRGTTESINLVASTFGKKIVQKGDNVLVTAMEHHSNMVPWQQLCKQSEAQLLVTPINDLGETDLDHFAQQLQKQPKIIAITHISNALGSINPIKKMVQMAHELDIPVLIDGAQSIAHTPIDVIDLDCDFFVFSGHKAYAPMGIGVLYGKEKWLEFMPPYQFGGEMVDQVSFETTTFNKLPFKFEAGTPNVSGSLALETALKFLYSNDIELVAKHEHDLLNYATQQLSAINGIRFIGQAAEKTAVVSFVIGDIHPFDLGTLLDKMGIAVRTGHHCAQPVMDRFNIPGTVRASFAMYNTFEEIDLFISAVKKSVTMLA